MKLFRKMVAPTIWLILLSFTFFGVQNLIVGLKKETQGVGRVFGKTVTFKEFQDAMRSAEFFWQSPEKPKSAEELETAAWQNLALLVEADHEKITVSDDEVREEIKTFFGGQVPSADTYQKWTSQVLKERPYDFEERVRKVLKVQKLMASHQNVVAAPKDGKVEIKPEELTEAQKKYTDWFNGVMVSAKIEKFQTPGSTS